ncbi:MAG: DUF4421 domain-containing protein [Chitinophagaceae bacterium]|nr:DUF4421 domain-containing protein [Chitinophagaceae bacterium]
MKLLLLAILLAPTAHTLCQEAPNQPSDTSYYKSYTNLITARYFFSQKYTSITVQGKTTGDRLQYRPNTNLNMGVGFTYGWFTLNLAFTFPLLNSGDEEKPETKYLDLQSHIYTSKFIVDVVANRYRGYYLAPKGTASPEGSDYYQRPDMKVWHIGVSGYKVLNWKKYSFRAAMQQNEWQQKSAGSILVGAEIYYGRLRTDSSIIPKTFQENFDQNDITSVRAIDIGPGAGYAYTLVLSKSFYLMGSATCTLPLDWITEYRSKGSESNVSVGPNLSYRASAGYNTPRWGVSALWVNNRIKSRGASGPYQVQTGNVRLNLIYRFEPGPRLKRKIRIFSFD